MELCLAYEAHARDMARAKVAAERAVGQAGKAKTRALAAPHIQGTRFVLDMGPPHPPKKNWRGKWKKSYKVLSNRLDQAKGSHKKISYNVLDGDYIIPYIAYREPIQGAWNVVGGDDERLRIIVVKITFIIL